MAKKIFATDAEIDEIIRGIKAQLSGRKVFGEVCVKKSLTTTISEKAVVTFSPDAWVKMTTLVKSYDSEVEWHGTVRRTDKNKWSIDDILVFPHVVAAATVTSDQKEYEAWLNTLDDDTFNSLRYHGHSHVNMGVTPSGVDMKYREDVVSTLQSPGDGVDSFYIFLILNKKGEWSGEIYDLTNNILYEKNDIEIEITVSGFGTASKFIEDAKTKAKKLDTPPTSTTSKALTKEWAGQTNAAGTTSAADKKKTDGVTSKTSYKTDYYSQFSHSPYDDDEERYGYYGGAYSYR